MNLYLLSLLIVLLCISLSESSEKRGKAFGGYGSKGARSSIVLKNGKKLRKVHAKKRMNKQNETETRQISKIAEQKIFRRKHGDQNSPRLRKKHKKINTIANEQPIRRDSPSKRRKVKKKGYKKRNKRKRIKVAQDQHEINDKKINKVNSQPSNKETIVKNSQSIEQPGKRHVSRYELNSNSQERTEMQTKRRNRKKKRRWKKRPLVKTGTQKNAQSTSLNKKSFITNEAHKRRKPIEDKKLIDRKNITSVPLKNQDINVKSLRETRKKFHKKKIRRDASVESKKTTSMRTVAPESLSTKKPGVTVFEDFRKIPTFNPDEVILVPFFNFNREKVTGRKVEAKDGTILTVDKNGMYHWGENFTHTGFSEDDYYEWKRRMAYIEDWERRVGNSWFKHINDDYENKPSEILCDEILPDKRCKYLVDRKCLKKYDNGECAKEVLYFFAKDWKMGDNNERLPPEEVTYPPPPSKEEILKQEKEAYYRSHCVLNRKQCASVYEIAYKEWDAVEGIISLHKRRMRLLGRATRPYDDKDAKQHGAVFLLEELLSEGDHSCQFVASVFPSIKPYLAKYAENCRF